MIVNLVFKNGEMANTQGALMEKNNKKENLSNGLAKKTVCPFINKPFEGCYCTSTSSLNTEAIINYCGGNFNQCDIYRKFAGSKGFEI